MDTDTASKLGVPPSTSEPEAPVEMTDLSSQQPPKTDEPDTTAGASQTQPSAPTDQPQSEPTPEPASALGPATDAPIALPPTDTSSPTLSITLMLTTGARHPYNITRKYLESRKVELSNSSGAGTDFDPRDITGYKLKELIWTDWRTAEWEPRPASPSAIRLIILGRLVDDNVVLRDLPFKLDAPNVLHMTVKPADFLDDDDATAKTAAKGRGGRRRSHAQGGEAGEERGAGCRCVIL